MSLYDRFQHVYLVQYSLNSDKTINPIKALPLYEVKNKYGGTFIGAKGGGPYGIRFVLGATHLGLFDLSDPENPTDIYSTRYQSLAKRKPLLIKCSKEYDNAYIIITRGDKNFKLIISEYPGPVMQRKAMTGSNRKTDSHTKKAQTSLKNINYKKEQ
jgi:hypothetical protein